ncbi:hypothetical protein BGZ57DRAFT_770755, partial [Hyaloscypha finlandica]
ELRFRYTNNIYLYYILNSLDTNISYLVSNIYNILIYREVNKIFFILEKLKIIHLTTK